MRHFRLSILFIIFGSLALGWPHGAIAKTKRTAKKTQTPSNLEQRVEDLEQQQKIFERNQELKEEEREKKEKEKPIAGAGPEGFFLKSADGKFQLKFRGYIQADARFYFGDENNPKKPANTFLLRRVRPILEGQLTKYFEYKIMPDFGEGKVTLQDAYINTRIKPEIQIQLGKYKNPVGLERLQSATDLEFVERGLPTNLVPNRDIGVELHGNIAEGLFTYQLGVFNGVVDGGSGDIDLNSDKEFAGRIFVHPFKKTSIKPLHKLGLGVAGTWGSPSGDPNNTGLPSYKSAGQQTFFSYRNDGTPTGTTVADGNKFRLAPQGYFYYGPFGILGEYVLSSQKVRLDTTQADLLNKSWQVATSFVLYGGNASYKGVNPKKPLGWTHKGTGAFELAARYGELSVDKDAFPIFADPNKAAQKAREWGVGFNWYINKNAKFMLSYDQTKFSGGGANGSNRPTEKVLLNRYQIAF